MQAETFYFKDMTAAPVTSAHVKKHTHTDPVTSEVLDIDTCGRGGEMSPRLKRYLVKNNISPVWMPVVVLLGHHSAAIERESA